jgi:hypothetical protein
MAQTGAKFLTLRLRFASGSRGCVGLAVLLALALS